MCIPLVCRKAYMLNAENVQQRRARIAYLRFNVSMRTPYRIARCGPGGQPF